MISFKWWMWELSWVDHYQMYIWTKISHHSSCICTNIMSAKNNCFNKTNKIYFSQNRNVDLKLLVSMCHFVWEQEFILHSTPGRPSSEQKTRKRSLSSREVPNLLLQRTLTVPTVKTRLNLGKVPGRSLWNLVYSMASVTPPVVSLLLLCSGLVFWKEAWGFSGKDEDNLTPASIAGFLLLHWKVAHLSSTVAVTSLLPLKSQTTSL